jgi:F-box protein 11
MSYVRFDDKHDDGQLSSFRERLENEVRIQTGDAFPIFQDRNNIAWGENWKHRIEDTLDAVTLLLVIMTPGLFKSPACREEVARFRERERKLGRGDLILPVYYVSARAMDDPALRRGDDVAELLWSRQYADWRELRFEPMTSPVARRAVAQLATRMADAFSPGPMRSAVALARAATPSSARSVAAAAPADSARTEPPTRIVDAYQRGGAFATVSAAIKAAKPGDRILVRPGLYQECLVIDKPLEIIGDGPVEDIEIRGRGASVLSFQATIGRVANLTLRQVAGDSGLGVEIRQGRLDLEGCDLSSKSGSCIYIRDSADPRVRGNRIHDARDAGVLVYGNGLGTLEDNEISGGGKSGVIIREGGNPVLRRNQISDNRDAGVLVYDNGLGMLEDNEIAGNGLAGVIIRDGGSPVVRRNQIRDGKQGGVYIHSNGLGLVEDNDIAGNALTGVEIRTGASPTVRGNRINRNAQTAVYIHDGGKGVIEDNDLTGNAGGAWCIASDCEPNVTRARNAK